MSFAKLSTFAALICLATFPTLVNAANETWAHLDSDIAVDPTVTFGTLDNGMHYAILPNAEPPGRVSLRLHVATGSLNETEEQRGLAHFLEHMVFNGSKHFPDASTLIPKMQRLGIAFGAHANAYTSFDETVYMLDLPNLEPDTLDLAFTVLRDYADGALLTADEINNERGVILAELNSRDSVQMRLMEQRLEFLMPDFLATQRLPIGLESVIKNANREQFTSYYSDHYTAANISFVVVGDIDPIAYEARIQEVFGSMTTETKEPAPDLGTLPEGYGLRSGVFSDEEVSQDSLSLSTLKPYTFEPDTVENRLKYLPLQVANAILSRRLDILSKTEDSPIKGGSANLSYWLDAIESESVSVSPEAGKWPESVAIMEQELRRALEFGFTQAEVDEITAKMLNAAEEAAKSASTRKSPALASGILGSINGHYVFSHPEEDLRIQRIGLERMTPETCHAAFKKIWDTEDLNLILTTKEAAEDTAQQLTELYQASQSVTVEAPEIIQDQAFAYTDFGEAGSILKETHVEDLDFVQLELSNHVRVNLKQTDFQKNSILLTARFGNGMLTQPKELPGLPMLTTALLNSGGLGAHSNDELQRILAGRNVGYSFGIGEDAFTLSGSTTPDDLELELQLMCAGLTDSGYRDEALRQFHKQLPAFASQLQYTLGGASAEMQEWLYGGDGRFAKPDPDQLMTYTIEDVQSWVTEEMQHAPLELSIVGDFDPQTAIPLILKTFGALPDREQSSPPLAAERLIEQPTLPADMVFTYDSKIDKAVAIVSWPGTAIQEDVRESRRMNILATILSDRLRKKLREELGSTYSPNARFTASRVFNSAYLSTSSIATSAETALLQENMQAIAQDIAENGATQDELDRALNPILGELKMHLRDNRHWLSTILSQSQSKPYTVEWARERDEDYASITLEEVNALAARYLTQDAARITLMPQTDE
jgi:zinc protease